MKAFIELQVIKNFLDRIEGEWIIEAHITLEDAKFANLANFPELPSWYSLDELKEQPWLKEAKEFAAKYGCKHLYEVSVKACDYIKEQLGIGPMKQYMAVYGPTSCKYGFKARNTRWAKAFSYRNFRCEDVKIYEKQGNDWELVATLDCPGKTINTQADLDAIGEEWSYEDYSNELLTL